MELSAEPNQTSDLLPLTAIKAWREHRKSAPAHQVNVRRIYREARTPDDQKLVQYVLDKMPSKSDQWAEISFVDDDFEVLLGLETSWFPYKMYTLDRSLFTNNLVTIDIMKGSARADDYRVRYSF